MTKDTAKDQEVWKNAINELATKEAGTFTSDDIEKASDEVEQDTLGPVVSDEPVAVEPESKKPSASDTFITRRRKDTSRLGNYHAPTEYDKKSLEETKAFIEQTYDQYEGESLEELAGILEEAGIHIHKIFYQNNKDIPAIRAFYHRPIIVVLPDKELPDKDILFDKFYIDLVLPKEEPIEEDSVEEAPEKKSLWKRMFRKD